MSFLWSPSKPEAPASEVKGKAQEFDDLLDAKDLELQAILGGGAPAESGAQSKSGADANPYVNTAEGSASSSKEKTGARAGRVKVPAPAALAAAPETKLQDQKMVLGVPRNYVVVVAMALIMAGFFSVYAGDIWGDTELNSKTIETEPAR